MKKQLLAPVFRKAGERVLPYVQKFGDDVLKTLKPDFSTTEGVVNSIVRYGPDLIWPMMLLNNLPEGTSTWDKVKAYGEDLGLNLLGSAFGQYGGAKLGRAAVTAGAPNVVAGSLQTIGDLGAGMAQVQIPRPTFNRVLNESGLEQQEIREAEIRQEEQEKMEQIINSLITGGAIGGSLAYPHLRKVS